MDKINFRHKTIIWLVPLALAWVFDLLFWNKTPGISIPIFIALCLAGGLVLALREGLKPAKASLILLLPILFFGGMLAVRQEAVTMLANMGLTLAGMAILAMTLVGGQWLNYSVSDYFSKIIVLGVDALFSPFLYFFTKKETEDPVESTPRASRPWILPLLRGLLLALPIVALLAALLASADPIFSTGLQDFLKIFAIENLGEYILRGFYILILAMILLGIFLHAFTRSHEENLIGVEKPWLAPFLGWIEATTILGSVDLLFAIFVAVQFRYFFGGQANIHLSGFTYAEYARRGFSELAAVAFISLLLFLGLSGVTKRAGSRQRSVFTGLGIVLVLLVIVILVSAYQRLLLYEAAYGFSRIRTYTHIFLVWLGLLLVATIILEIVQRPRAFALAALVASMGFGLTLDAVNVDSFIARQNANRVLQGFPLDSGYLVSLSTDATPELARLYTDPALPAAAKDQVGAALACRIALKQDSPDYRPAWMSFHFSQYWAALAVAPLQDRLSAYPVQTDDRGTATVRINGVEQPCFAAGSTD